MSIHIQIAWLYRIRCNTIRKELVFVKQNLTVSSVIISILLLSSIFFELFRANMALTGHMLLLFWLFSRYLNQSNGKTNSTIPAVFLIKENENKQFQNANEKWIHLFGNFRYHRCRITKIVYKKNLNCFSNHTRLVFRN